MQKTVIKNFSYIFSYQILSIFVPLITTPYLSRTIGSECIGRYSYFFSISQYFAMFVLLGVNNYGNREIARARISGNRQYLSSIFWEIYIIQFVMGIIICLCFYIFCKFFFNSDVIINLFIINIISHMLDITWLFNGLEKFKIVSIRNLFIKCSSAIYIFVFVKSSNDFQKYCLIMLCSPVISQFSLWGICNKEIDFIKITLKDIIKHIKPNLVLFLSVLGVSLYKQMDKIMLGNMSGFLDVGYYEQAEKIINIPLIFITSLGTVMLPRMVVIHGIGEKDEFKEVFIKSLKIASISSSVIIFGILTVNNEFVPLYYGDENLIIITLFKILLPSCIFLAIGNVITTQYLIPDNKDKVYIKSIFIGAAVNLIINIICIPKLRCIGAAIGTLLAEISVCIYKAVNVKSLCTSIEIIKNVKYIAWASLMYILISSFHFYESDILNILVKLFLGILYVICSLGVYYIHRKVTIDAK